MFWINLLSHMGKWELIPYVCISLSDIPKNKEFVDAFNFAVMFG